MLIVLVTSSMLVSDAFATQIQIVTDLGNVFTVQKTSPSNSTNNGSMSGAGLGTAARIQTVQPQGTLVYGSGYIGTTSPIKPYVSVPPGTNFGTMIQNNDSSVSLNIPEFARTYDYTNGQLQMEQINLPNVLSYSGTRVLSGDIFATQTASNIQTSGTGAMVLKLNSMAGKEVTFRGTVAPGATVQIAESFDPSIDLTQTPYDPTYGFNVFSSPSISESSQDVYYGAWACGRCSYYYYYSYTTYTLSAPVNKIVSSLGNSAATYYWETTDPNCALVYSGGWRGAHWGYSCSSAYGTHQTPHVLSAQINGHPSGSNYFVQSISLTGTTTDHTNGIPTQAGRVLLYDKAPYKPVVNSNGNFEQAYTFPTDNSQIFIIANQPQGGVSTVLAEQYDPNIFSFLKINGLPPNTPYEIVKDGMIGAAGLTPADGSSFAFDVSQIGFQTNDQSPGGVLKIFPNSAWYRGEFNSVLLDPINRHSFSYPGPSQIHVPYAFIRIPLAANTAISGAAIDDTIQVPYLAGHYQAGNALLVPTIPSMTDIEFSANGTPMKIAIADVIGDTGVTVLSGNSASDSHYSLTSAISANAGVDGEATVIATHDGTLNGIISLAVSANANYYSGSSTLTVYVNTYVNGNLVGTKALYTSQPPTGYSSQTIQSYTISPSFTQYGQYSFTQTNPFPYSVDTYNVSDLPISGTVTVQAHTGDMVEFEVYADENAQSGLIATAYSSYCDGWMGININTGKEGCYTYGYNPTAKLSEASSTVSLDEGYILAG